VRRNLSDEHVKRIHRAFAGLWPEDTDLASLLPRPNPKVLRSVYMGFSDPRTVEATVLGWLPFVDEIVLVNPFFLGTRMKPEFSPIDSPTGHKMQTLKNVMLLLVLKPFIRAGLVHLVPDPGEVSALLGHHVSIASNTAIGGEGFGFVPTKTGMTKIGQLGRVVIGNHVDIGNNVAIDRGSLGDTVIGDGTVLDNLIHIAHNVRIGKGCIFAAQCGIAGSTVVGDYVMAGGHAAIKDHVVIGNRVRIAAKSGVIHNIPDGATIGGLPAIPTREWHRQTVALARLAQRKSDKD